jgi:hypothetical protein
LKRRTRLSILHLKLIRINSAIRTKRALKTLSSLPMLVQLKYLADLPLYEEEKPYTLYGYPDEVTPKTNCKFVHVNGIAVADIRGRESEFNLGECGFEYHKKPSSCDLRASMFESAEGRESVWRYLRETIQLAQETFNCPKVLCFDWRVRWC